MSLSCDGEKYLADQILGYICVIQIKTDLCEKIGETGTVAKCLFHFVASHVSQRLNTGCRSKYHGTFAKKANAGFSDVQHQLLTHLIFSHLSPGLHYISSHPFSPDKGLGKQSGGRDQGEKKSFPFGMEMGEKEEGKLMLTGVPHY